MGCVASKPMVAPSADAAPAQAATPAADKAAPVVPPQRLSPTSPLSWDEMYTPKAEKARLQSLL